MSEQLPAEPNLQAQRDLLGLGLGFIGVVIFGATLPMTRLAVLPRSGLAPSSGLALSSGLGLDPFFVTTGRAALAGLLAFCVLAILRRPLPPRQAYLPLVGASVLLVWGFPGFTGFAMQTVPAAHGGVVLGILPLVTAAFGVLIMGNRPRPLFWLFAGAGAVLVVLFSLRDSGGGLSSGDFLLGGATLSAALGYVLSARAGYWLSGWEIISWALVIALPLTIPAAVWSMPAQPDLVSPVAWMAFAYLAIMSQYIGFFAWNAGLMLGGVAKISQVQLLQSFITLGFAALLLHEKIEPLTWGAALLVVIIVFSGRKYAR